MSTTPTPTPNDGGPAFPTKIERVSGGYTTIDYLPGMSLRDWFAGQALGESMKFSSGFTSYEERAQLIARFSFAIADAMVAERDKPKPSP